MLGSLLITLREGLEAALIIGIIISYLSNINQRHLTKYIFVGTTLGILSSIAAAILFKVFVGDFEGKPEQVFEGVVMLVAVIVLTITIIWMNRESKSIGENIRFKVDRALEGKHILGLVFLAYVSVLREGIEVVLFMNAAILSSSQVNSLLGGILGLVAAIVIAYMVFMGTHSLNLKKFFQVIGLFIIFVAAGMLAGAIHEFEEAGILPVIIEHIWDISSVLNEKGIVGSFMKAIFSYNSNPSLSEVAAYVLYFVISIKTFFFRKKQT